MTAVHVEDVAVALLERQGPLDTIKLQKLTYYCQAWFVTWVGDALFPDDLEAWDNGPVSRRLFNMHRGRYKVGGLPQGDSSNLPAESEGVLEFVRRYYGAWSGADLVNHVHEEDPWNHAYHTVGRNSVIPVEALTTFYGSLEDFNDQSWVWLSGAYRDVDVSVSELAAGQGETFDSEDEMFEALNA